MEKKNVFLFADPLFGKFTSVYKQTNTCLQLIDFDTEIDIVQINTKRIDQNYLPQEISEKIIVDLFLNYVTHRQGSFAANLLGLSKFILKQCYHKFFHYQKYDSSLDRIYKLSTMLRLLTQTDDHLIDLIAHPLGHNSGLLYTVVMSVSTVHGKIHPWYFDGDMDIMTMLSPTIYTLSDSKDPTPKYVAEVITGPNHYNLLYVRGKALKNGLVKVNYFKSPIIVFQVTEFVPHLDVTIEMLCEPGWKALGKLARAFYGPQAGIYVSVTGNGLGMWETGIPAIFEI